MLFSRLSGFTHTLEELIDGVLDYKKGKSSEDTVGEILLNNFGNVILHENSDYFRSDRIIKS
ncbi:MAG: hypothetical protein HC773_21310 [Scytonema sp. CRU_2_7]|nr:hypothetical protein [Scytonema sp. CRU_2_7]